MDFVQPIRDKKQIDKMKDYLQKQNYRDYVLFILGINSGLRISDLLGLTVEDVKGKDRIILREKKQIRQRISLCPIPAKRLLPTI